MLSFAKNFFFLRFSLLFFVLLIFGYWEMDLNSEELYIAVSFFILIVASFIIVRGGVLLFFVKSVNRKYARIASVWIIWMAFLETQLGHFRTLTVYLNTFLSWIPQLLRFAQLTFESNVLAKAIFLAKQNFLSSIYEINLRIFISKCIRSRRSTIFFGKFFDIKI